MRPAGRPGGRRAGGRRAGGRRLQKDKFTSQVPRQCGLCPARGGLTYLCQTATFDGARRPAGKNHRVGRAQLLWPWTLKAEPTGQYNTPIGPYLMSFY